MYVESMGRTLQNLFKAYYSQLAKQDGVVAGKGDLVVVEEATLKSMFSSAKVKCYPDVKRSSCLYASLHYVIQSVNIVLAVGSLSFRNICKMGFGFIRSERGLLRTDTVTYSCLLINLCLLPI